VPNIAVYHPQIVHFVIALLYVGVGLRVISLLGRPKWVGPAAATLILLGSVAAMLAVRSGTDAHGPVERIPGARSAVQEHEDWGIRTRNVFYAVAALELLTLALAKKERVQRFVKIGSAVVGIAGLVVLFEAGEHGGHLVYQFAGGVGTRSGDPEDVTRLLIAGLYNEAALQRKEGNGQEAARLAGELLRVRPDDPEFRYSYAQSRMTDLHDPAAALDALSRISIGPDQRSLDIRKGTLTAQAYQALGFPDSARSVLQPLADRYPDVTRIKAMLDSIR
jgi:uncharacterized membrane protein